MCVIYREIIGVKIILEFVRFIGVWYGVCYNIFRGLDLGFFLIYVFVFNFFCCLFYILNFWIDGGRNVMNINYIYLIVKNFCNELKKLWIIIDYILILYENK